MATIWFNKNEGDARSIGNIIGIVVKTKGKVAMKFSGGN